MIKEYGLFCDWCNKEIQDQVIKLYDGLDLHVVCYEEYIDEQNFKSKR